MVLWVFLWMTWSISARRKLTAGTLKNDGVLIIGDLSKLPGVHFEKVNHVSFSGVYGFPDQNPLPNF